MAVLAGNVDDHRVIIVSRVNMWLPLQDNDVGVGKATSL